MADDRHYVGGEHYVIDDRSGFKVRNTVSRKQWNNLIVREQSYEPRQPQDFVQGVTDDQTVADARPRSINVFIGPLTTETTVALPITSQIIPVVSALSWLVGDVITIMMNNGENMVATISDVPSLQSVQVNPGLSWSASNGARVVNTTASSNPAFPVTL